MGKNIRLSVDLKLFCTFFLFLFLLISCQEAGVEEDALIHDDVAYIYALEEITLDGNLAEWPKDMKRYPIQNLELGDTITAQKDYYGDFRMGYDLKKNAIFVAVEVVDESSVTDTTDAANWNTQDGIELYLDEAHLKQDSPVTQFSEYGNDRSAFGAQDQWEQVSMKKQQTVASRTYEWRIDLDKPIKTGQAIGLDLVVTDKDEDNSFSWISWTRGTQKVDNPERCGTVVLVAPGTETELIKGKLDLTALGSKKFPVAVRIQDLANSEMWFQTVADSLGNYAISVPPGSYEIEVPGKLLNYDYNFYRLAVGESKTFVVGKEETNTVPVLVAKMVPEPNLWTAQGLLHNFGEEQKRRVDEFVEAYRAYYEIPGVSLALLKDGQIVYHKTYGVINTNTKQQVNDNTLFEAASITKPVFAYVVLRLLEKGIIDLDKPLAQYLTFDELEAYPDYKLMTARHVLTHRSGLPNWGRRLENTPGEKYGYSGEGFEYLKRVVVKLMNKDIEKILDEQLISPFGLEHMEFSDSPELREVVATGHFAGKPTNWTIPQEAGMAFSMHTEAKAFAKFGITLLERKGLSEDTYKDFMTIHTKSNPEYWNNLDKSEGAGLGIFIRETDFGDTFFHGGNNGDFKCMFEIYKELGMGYVIYTNSDTGSELTDDIVYLLVEGNKPRER